MKNSTRREEKLKNEEGEHGRALKSKQDSLEGMLKGTKEFK